LIVDGEFEVKLGVINDNLTSPWRVYEIKLFVYDIEEPGKIIRMSIVFSEIFVFFEFQNKNSYIHHK